MSSYTSWMDDVTNPTQSDTTDGGENSRVVNNISLLPSIASHGLGTATGYLDYIPLSLTITLTVSTLRSSCSAISSSDIPESWRFFTVSLFSRLTTLEGGYNDN